jgi:hypothetical protein
MKSCFSIKFVCSVAMVLAMAGFPTYGLADDLNPPAWRGIAGSTFQQWEFGTGASNPSADLFENPFGTPTLEAFSASTGWKDALLGRQGVWPLSGHLIATIPQSPLVGGETLIWVQVTWTEEASGGYPFVREENTWTDGLLISESSSILGNSWIHSTYQILVPSTLTFDLVKITGLIQVDELVIDTMVVPEPTSFSLLALGMFGWVLCSRFRRSSSDQRQRI